METRENSTVSYRIKESTKQRAANLGVLGRGNYADAESCYSALLDAYENQSKTEENAKAQSLLVEVADWLGCTVDNMKETVASLNNKLYEAQRNADLYKQKNNEFEERIQTLSNDYEELQNQYNAKAEAYAHIGWEHIRTTMKPFVVDLLELTARKLSDKYNKKVTPMQVMVDMFLRYTIERWNQWFYPFVVKDDEIIRLAHQYNPDIKSISQLKSIVL